MQAANVTRDPTTTASSTLCDHVTKKMAALSCCILFLLWSFVDSNAPNPRLQLWPIPANYSFDPTSSVPLVDKTFQFKGTGAGGGSQVLKAAFVRYKEYFFDQGSGGASTGIDTLEVQVASADETLALGTNESCTYVCCKWKDTRVCRVTACKLKVVGPLCGLLSILSFSCSLSALSFGTCLPTLPDTHSHECDYLLPMDLCIYITGTYYYIVIIRVIWSNSPGYGRACMLYYMCGVPAAPAVILLATSGEYRKALASLLAPLLRDSYLDSVICC